MEMEREEEVAQSGGADDAAEGMKRLPACQAVKSNKKESRVDLRRLRAEESETGGGTQYQY